MSECKFKVGDKVRSLVEGVDICKGTVYTITADSDSVIFNDDVGELRSRPASEYELLAAPAKPEFKLGQHIWVTGGVCAAGDYNWGALNRFEAVITELPRDELPKGFYRFKNAATGSACYGHTSYLQPMEPAFKVGDRVRIAKRKPDNKTGGCDYRLPNGDVGTVGRIKGQHQYRGWRVERESDGKYVGYFADEELEIAPEVTTQVPEGITVGSLVRLNKESWGYKEGMSLDEIARVHSVSGSSVNAKGFTKYSMYYDNICNFELVPQPTSTTEGIYTGTDTGFSAYMASPTTSKPINQMLPKSSKETKKMTTKYYRVKKDLPAWNAGAILKLDSCDNTYVSINDLWDSTAVEKVEDSVCEHAGIVENSPEWFERVYEVGLLGKTKYLVKDAAQKAYSELHKAAGK